MQQDLSPSFETATCVSEMKEIGIRRENIKSLRERSGNFSKIFYPEHLSEFALIFSATMDFCYSRIKAIWRRHGKIVC